jgi:ABC-type Fe3+-siderophore transport system permease subunit
MKARNVTVAAILALALMITFGSANRAEAHRGWGWGIGAGIATALILGAIYRHHHRHYYILRPSVLRVWLLPTSVSALLRELLPAPLALPPPSPLRALLSPPSSLVTTT